TMTEDQTTARRERNRKVERVIGILLLISIAYFIYSNFGISWPVSGRAVHSSESTLQQCGPRTLTETYPEQLRVRELGFRVLNDERKAVLEVVNADDVPGEVRVTIYCINGDAQGEQVSTIEPGRTEIFSFLDVPDCDLEYYVSPGIVYRQRNISVASGQEGCDGI
ncbi:hypothetical protein KY363_06295, partial [Candidatus Woesearchaeota archaeon]|nr:hypothetical protein [Candidatus Woesearchaeota archaeon]